MIVAYHTKSNCKMTSLVIVVHFVAVFLLAVQVESTVYDGDCHGPWMYQHNETSECKCGNTLNGKVQCNMNTSTLTVDTFVCMTYNPATNRTVAGYCLYSSIYNIEHPTYQLPMIRDDFNNLTCGIWKRDGLLCSQCIQDHGIQLYSYYMDCVKCTGFQVRELFVFFAVTLFPPTVLCIVVTLFHLNVLRPPWSVFVLMAQMLSAPVVTLTTLTHAKLHNYTKETLLFSPLATLYGPWNLDFFRAFYGSICISPHITQLQSAAIEGCIGLYPLILLSMLYLAVKLRDRGCTFVTKAWKPFNFLLSRFRSRLNLKSSLIDTFATFFLLSYMKLGYYAFYILAPTRLWSPDGSHVWVVYYDPSVRYFGSSHSIYAIPTLLISLMVLVVPLILLFIYPYRWFQRCLNRFHLRYLAVNAFVDAFQGCFKDGTNGTRDCRYFSSLQLLLRLLFPLILFTAKDYNTASFLSSVLLSIYIACFVIMQPYKDAMYNKTDIPMLVALLIINISLTVDLLASGYIVKSLSVVCIAVVCFVPLLYLVIWACVHIKYYVTVRSCCRPGTMETDRLLSRT